MSLSRSQLVLLRLTLCVGALLPAAMSAQATLTPDEAAIRAAREAQNQAIAAGQFDSVASFWVRDVAVVAGLGVALQGRDLLRAAFAADSGIIYERSPSTVTVGSHWSLGWEEGTWTGRRGAAPAPPLIAGRYSAQWVKVNGRWLIRSELFVALTCSGQACRWPAAHPPS
jgi:ketosteroid isomerase-like protein